MDAIPGADGLPAATARLLAAAAGIASPACIIDLATVEEKYRALRAALPGAEIFYAVKSNPHPQVLRRLEGLGCGFDIASPGELQDCRAAGAPVDRLSFGNTIKKESAIAAAHAAGVRLFAVDSPAELEKLARAAPGSTVFVRLGVAGTGAEWPLTHKFGCTSQGAQDLLERAGQLGLHPKGISFHVGSQQLNPEAWRHAIHRAGEVFRHAARRGVQLEFLNLGGGLPAHYVHMPPPLEAYMQVIRAALAASFGASLPRLFVEPGRYMVGDAGILVSEVVLVAERPHERVPRWVYLDAGIYTGLDETAGERIHYRMHVPNSAGAPRPTGPVVMAGPTCDSADVMYRHGMELPLDLAPGERVIFLSAGAYTSSCSTVGFNGFPPLPMHCI